MKQKVVAIVFANILLRTSVNYTTFGQTNLFANYCSNLTSSGTAMEVLLRFLIRNFFNRAFHSYLLITVHNNMALRQEDCPQEMLLQHISSSNYIIASYEFSISVLL